MSLLNSAEALQYTIGCAGACRAALEDGSRAMRDLCHEALVLDQTSRGFDLVAMQLGIPYAHVSNAPHFNSGRTPLCIFDWQHEIGPEALARNRRGVEHLLTLTAQITEVQWEYAERVSLN